MWRNTYKDYKPDEKWIKQQVNPGHGIVGCEMHEINGWGEKKHVAPPKKEGWLRTLAKLFSTQKS